jgi:hypothetical protein|tara:strand:+ start:80 stop:1105 length:1026 start_codon:yes stop_codon:yes gene_type:complete
MAIRYWDGDTSTACTTATNWSADTAPIAADEVIFDGREQTAQGGGGFYPTTVCAQGDTGGIDYDLLHVKKTYGTAATDVLGVAGTPFHTSAQKIIIEGIGIYYIECSESTAVSQTIPLVIVNNKNATVYLTSNINDGAQTCQFNEIRVLAGTVHIGNDGSSNVATYTPLTRIVPRNNKASNVTVTEYIDCIKTNGGNAGTVFMCNGTYTTDSEKNVIDLLDGTFNYGTDLGGSPETGLDIATLRQYDGTFNWYPDDSGDPKISDLFIYGGTFDASAATNLNRAKVLGDGAGNDIFLHQGGTINVANNKGNITLAASSQLWNFGGTLITDNGSEIGVTYDQP